MKRLVLQIQNYRVSMTQSHNRISIGGPMMIQYIDDVTQTRGFYNQPYQTSDPWQWTFTSRDVWTKGYTVAHTVTHCNFHNKIFFHFLMCIWKGEGWVWLEWEDQWYWDALWETHKESIKSYQQKEKKKCAAGIFYDWFWRTSTFSS